MLISSSSRYSIYKVQSCSRLPLGSLELLYLSTLKPLCQELFSSFFKLFCSRSSFSVAPCRFRSRLAYISICLTICQALFSLFFDFSSGILQILSSRPLLRCLTTVPGILQRWDPPDPGCRLCLYDALYIKSGRNVWDTVYAGIWAFLHFHGIQNYPDYSLSIYTIPFSIHATQLYDYILIHPGAYFARKQIQPFSRGCMLALPIFPGRPTYCPCVASVRWTLAARM